MWMTIIILRFTRFNSAERILLPQLALAPRENYKNRIGRGTLEQHIINLQFLSISRNNLFCRVVLALKIDHRQV